MQHELARVGSPVPTTALRALVGSYRGEVLPAERLGRVLGYERQRYLTHRRPPRIAVAITPDARPAQPQRLADGDWRLGRRIVTPDALRGQAAALGVQLCERAEEVPAARELLRPHVEAAAEAAFGKTLGRFGSDWSALRLQFLRAQPHSIGALSPEQWEAEQVMQPQALRPQEPSPEQATAARALESQAISGLVQYFGSDTPVVTATPLTSLRAPQPGENGEAFDDLVRRRAGDPSIAREVLAFIQEWGRVVDELQRRGLDRTATIEDYVQRWKVSEQDAREHLRLFHQVLPGESDPGAVWQLLWDAVPEYEGVGRPAFVRLTSQPVVDSSEPPSLVGYFIASLYEQLTRPLGARLRSAGLQPKPELHDQSRDLRRLYELANRAVHTWACLALGTEGPGSEASLLGLKSLGYISDDGASAVAEQAIGGYRQRASGRGTRSVLLSVQKCLRICASLSLLDPPLAVTPLLPGVRWAASALAALCAQGIADPVQEVEATLLTLYAVP
jgi:hypothetical protein